MMGFKGSPWTLRIRFLYYEKSYIFSALDVFFLFSLNKLNVFISKGSNIACGGLKIFMKGSRSDGICFS